MAIKTNTFVTYSAVGNREDLSDIIYNISPTETPFQTMIGRGTADATFTEWQTDSLAAVDTANAQVEGDDVDSAGYQAITPTVRLGNYCQISRKTAIVSNTQKQVRKAGRRDEMAYQIAKRGKELKRDMEAILLSNQAANAGNASTARRLGSLLAFIKTNVNAGAGGANPNYTNVPTSTRTDGTQRAFTETILKDVVQKTWTAGGNPSVLMVGPVNKQNVSAFTGIAAQRYNVQGAKPSTIIGAADIYVSDFGNLSVVPNRFQRERDAFLLDPEFLALSFLRPIHSQEIAKTGDAEKRLILAEYTLVVKNEAAHGLCADLTTTTS